MQNLAASANFQLFSKALQEAVPLPPRQGSSPSNGTVHAPNEASEHAQQQGGQAALSAADLHQLMLSQIDQQIYLSQLAGLGSVADSSSMAVTTNPLFSSALPASSGSSDSATTTTSNSGQNNSINDGPPFGQTSTAADEKSAHQKLVEQLLEATACGQHQTNGQQQSDELVSQLMAQLVNGSNNAGELQAQLAAMQHQQHVVAGQQQQRADAQSPSQQQMSLSLLEQLQLLQVLGSGANPASVPGLAELLSGSNGSSSLSSASAAQQANELAQFLKGAAGSATSGGSPSKAEQAYCELCDKWLCNRYFLRTHMFKKHGIGDGAGAAGGQLAGSNNSSPMKSGTGNFFGATLAPQQQHGTAEDAMGRARSASLHQHSSGQFQHAEQRDSPSVHRLVPKLSVSSTPGMNSSAAGPSSALQQNNTTSTESLSPDQQQQMAVMQQLAAQLGGDGGRMFEQLFGAGALPQLGELIGQQAQQQSDVHRASSPSRSPVSDVQQSYTCAHCAKQFGSQTALFQHQLTEHIGDSAHQLQQQQSTSMPDSAAAQSSIDALAMMAAGMGGNAVQQQQIFNQLLGSPTFTSAAPSSLMFPTSTNGVFGGLGPAAADFDNATMLAKLSAELAAAAQGQIGAAVGQLGGAQMPSTAMAGGGMGQQQQTPGMAPKPPAQKRQYSSTSKNFCDLCNKEVCNKYFLRTHMLKMHNIVIDENKPLIANIDTMEKERKGEVRFRCDICHASMATRDELRAHKREMHGMQPASQVPSQQTSGGAAVPKQTQPPRMGAAMETTTPKMPPQQQSSGGPFAQSLFESAMMEAAQQQHRAAETGTANDENQPVAAMGEREANAALANPVKQLLSLIGEPLIGTARMPQMKKELDEPQSAQQQFRADANNNANSCRFCGLCLEEEAQLQLHQLTEHPAEYIAMLQSADPAEDTITQVALQMAEANSHQQQQLSKFRQQQQQQLRKTSAASSGASSSSAASSNGGALIPQPATATQSATAKPAKGAFACAQCKRRYKSVQKLQWHQSTVHHNLVAKLSPNKRPVISPKKIAKMLTSFACVKCRRRFSTRAECDEHVISHIRAERQAAKLEEGESESPSAKRAKLADEERELLAEWVKEQHEEAEEGPEGRLLVDEGEEEHREGGSGEGGGKDEERHQGATTHRRKRVLAAKGKEGEKHSHTSGSTSPVSVQAGSSSLLPEGFAHPPLDHPKPFLLQSFTLRPCSPHHSSQLPEELVAYLPVRSTLGEPIRVTFELQPNPQLDQQVQHL